MRAAKKTWQNMVYILIMLVAVILLFSWYSASNSRRIEAQNLTYAMDSARQTAMRINSEFVNAQRRVRNYAYSLSMNLDEPDISLGVLRELERNTEFDALRFINAEGISLATDGSVVDSADRPYFINGMRGENGCTVIFESRRTHETMMIFYAPLSCKGETFGVLAAVYLAEDYLREMLETRYFGEAADVFLCTEDGQIISTSSADSFDGPLPDVMMEAGVIDAETADGAREVFHSGTGEGAFACAAGSLTDNLCVVCLPGSEYVVVQTFPRSVTQAMVENANYAGMVLQSILIGLFIAYIVILLLRARKMRRKLETENQEMGYITSGVATLFTRFVLVDLEEGAYRFLTGSLPKQDGFAVSGRYGDFVTYLCGFLAEEPDKLRFAEELTREAVVRELTDTTNIQYEYKIQRDGAITWEHINIICLKRREGRAWKVLFLRNDVTRLKEKELTAQAEISLANRKERQYRIAVTASSFCTFEFNLTQDLIEQDVVYTEDGKQISSLESVGLSAPCPASVCFEKWKGHVLEETLEEYAALTDLERLRQRFEEDELEVTADYWCRTAGDQQMCVRQSFIMTRDDTGDIMVMVVSKNITAQVQKQREQTQALQEALMQAQHANQAKTNFLSNMSHDIRTPMNAIIGFTTIAIDHIDNRRQVLDYLQKVRSSSNHLLSLINDILDMSRIESGKVQIKEQECNLSELTHSLVNIIQPQVKAKQMELFIDTFDVVNEDVIADSLKLNQVFLNLMSNAVKYTPAGGMVSFRISQEASAHPGWGNYVFVVKDNGIGMSPEFLEHIFEPFEREASTTKTGIQGTGLGMAITKTIVDMMGGVITVSSEKSKGSEFQVQLSLKLQDVEENKAQIKELEGLRAIVVDDDCDGCESVVRMLDQIGLRAEWTTSGREAVHRAKSAYNEGDPYHTYIIDWQMPELSGIETARRIRAVIGQEAPIIILTAYDWTEIEEEAKQAGVTAFCTKPLFMSDLKSALLEANHLTEKQGEQLPWTQVDFTGKRILLVEDNELNREIAEAILEESGLEVEPAPDGIDAVEMMRKAEEHYYDAILMDVQMPVMDGYEATRTIRALHREDVKDIPIIAMTANAMEEDKETALKSGMNAHIAKPLDIELFLSILGKYLN